MFLRERCTIGAISPSPRRRWAAARVECRARQGDRRLVLDQCDGLCARPPRRLRPLGAQCGLPHWSYAHVLPYFRRQESWEGGADRLSRRRRAADDAARPLPRPDRSRPAWRPARQPGHPSTEDYNGERAGRLRPLADDDPRRPALQRRGRLSAPGAGAARDLIGRDRRAGDTRAVRGRRAPSASSISEDGKPSVARAEREVILAGGVDQLAAAPDAVRHRRPGRC